MDAFLVGVSFQFQHRSNIFVDVIIIGIVTFLICIVGSLLGRWSGKLLGKNCIIPGALILVLLGIKVIFTAG
jgi:putative Mn2+ efflux pump MntP